MVANNYGSFNNNPGGGYPSNNRRTTPVNTNGLVTVVGNLGSDVTIRTSRKGNDWATVSIAKSNGHYDGNSQWVDEGTTWYDVVLFGDVAHAAAETLRKGQRVIVQGTLSSEEWAGRDGQTHTSLKLTARNIGLTLGNQPKARRS